MKVRRNARVKTRTQKTAEKPDHLLFVNSVFGLEAPIDLPPLM